MNVSRITQDKIDGKWETIYTVTDAPTVYEELAHELIAKKLEHCSYIKSITRRQNYNGTITITITYADFTAPKPSRTIYTVESH